MDKLTVYLPGALDPCDSYGLIGSELLRQLSKLEVYTNAISLVPIEHPNQDAELARLAKQPVAITTGGLLLGYPTSFHRFGLLANMRPSIAITMFESSRVPSGWIEALSQCSTVVVPSLFCADVFRECGLPEEIPLHVVPLGVREVYQPVLRTPGRPFTFLAFMDRGKRKGGLVALQAFIRAFGDDPDYHLVLKARESRHKLEFDNENITVIQKDLTDDQLFALYGQCDALVNPNMGEGFGLIPREFAATGGISLATGWGGTADAISLWGVPLPYDLVPADWTGIKRFETENLGVWAQADPSEVAQVMRKVADNREYYAAKALAKAPLVKSTYSWKRFAQRVYELWKVQVYGNSYAA
jgi:glycosyltransferase involved in cell wall biosynthesis